MAIQEFSSKDRTISFEEIVLNHVQDLAKLSQTEYRGGYTDKKVSKNLVEEVYIPDNRKRMIQSIEFLEILLSPRFEKEAEKRYGKITGSLAENLKKYEDDKIKQDEFIVNKLNLSLKLFRKLMFLLHQSGYLKRRPVVG